VKWVGEENGRVEWGEGRSREAEQPGRAEVAPAASLDGVCVYYCSTYYKAVRVGGWMRNPVLSHRVRLLNLCGSPRSSSESRRPLDVISVCTRPGQLVTDRIGPYQPQGLLALFTTWDSIAGGEPQYLKTFRAGSCQADR
jgi:hypothetical protein